MAKYSLPPSSLPGVHRADILRYCVYTGVHRIYVCVCVRECIYVYTTLVAHTHTCTIHIVNKRRVFLRFFFTTTTTVALRLFALRAGPIVRPEGRRKNASHDACARVINIRPNHAVRFPLPVHTQTFLAAGMSRLPETSTCTHTYARVTFNAQRTSSFAPGRISVYRAIRVRV